VITRYHPWYSRAFDMDDAGMGRRSGAGGGKERVNDQEALNVLADSVRRLASDLRPTRSGSRDRTPPGDAGSWARIIENGWLYAGLAEEQGGLGGIAETVLVMEQVGRALLTQPLLANFLGLHGLSASSDPGAHQGLIAAILAGERRIAYAPPHRADTVLADGRLTGRRAVVPGGDSADVLLVGIARSSDRPARLAVVPIDAPGVSVARFALIDGSGASDITLTEVMPSEAGTVAIGDAADELIARLADLGAIATAADALGAMAEAFDLTLGYIKQRVQFGQPIGANQAIQHRMVDLLIAIREGEILLRAATAAFAQEPLDRSLAVSALKAHVGRAGRLVGQEAVQLHGGIGTTDEAPISHYARRLLAAGALSGDMTTHRRRFALDDTLRRIRDAGKRIEDSGAFDFTPEDRAFAAELRAFVAENLSSETAATIARGEHPTKLQVTRWEEALGRRGWLAYTWPREAGGPGLSVLQKFLFEVITAEMGAPAMNGLGIKMAGPVIQAFGTPEQKARHLTGILQGTVQWCQGYSEPGSGSDLASLTTHAERGRDRYVVNGQKIWTSFGHWADWMFMLVRTSRESTRQAGISFLLVDMTTPGITVRPIVSADGHHGLNEIFLENVEVPLENLVGEEGRGWTYAKYLLGHERLGIVSLPAITSGLALAQQAADLGDADGTPRGADAHFADRLVDLKIRARALQGWVQEGLRMAEAGGAPGAEVSLMKIRGTQLIQDLREFVIDAAGVDALPYDFSRAHNPPRPGTAAVIDGAMGGYIYERAFTILGGTTEIQKNIASKALLGL
jgi:3-oxochol-4-en-24-oyl-CoA dehydrogenase